VSPPAAPGESSAALRATKKYFVHVVLFGCSVTAPKHCSSRCVVPALTAQQLQPSAALAHVGTQRRTGNNVGLAWLRRQLALTILAALDHARGSGGVG
jgi:hypothetical protein